MPIPWGEKGPRSKGWQNLAITPDSVSEYFGSTPANIGLHTARLPMVDIDVINAALATEIEAEAMRRWPGALRRIGQPPKVGLFLRAEMPFRKMQTSKYTVADGVMAQVEIMADGQQCVAFGRHPAGCDYTWPDRSPLDVRREDLPEITEAAARDFLAWADDLLADAAGVGRPEPKPEGNLGKVYDIRNLQPGGFGFDTGARLSDRERTLDEAQELLSFIDPDASYKDWLNVLQALHDEFGDAGLSLADDWSSRGAKYKSGEVETKWRGFTAGGGVTFSTVATMARQGGADLSEISRRHSGAPEAPSFAERPQKAAKRGLTPTTFALGDPSQIPPRKWLYGRHFIRGFVSLTASPGGLGKSSLALVEAFAMATGKPLLGEPVTAPFRVWVWNGEDPTDELQRRATAIAMHHSIGAEDIGDRLCLDSGRDMPIKIAKHDKTGITIARPLVDELVETIRAREIDALIIDPFVTTHEVSENDNGAMNAVADAWREVADKAGCAVELIHHARKGARTGGAEMGIDMARGAGSVVDAARSARFLLPMSDDEASRAGLDSAKGFFQVVAGGKANLAPPPDKAVWRKMESVALGNGSGLYPEGDFVGVATAWEMPDAFAGLTVEDLKKVKRAVAAGTWKESEQSADWVGYAIAEALALGDIGPRLKSDRDAAQNGLRARVRQLFASWRRSGELQVVEMRDEKRRTNAPFVVTCEQAESEVGDGKAA